ncbi:hypothetical protein DQ354_18110 [Arthrobacter sp. AQ5-06]|nr:hypothetical protein DQ354_18110 [Arthrobacter sp. AQ5-06]
MEFRAPGNSTAATVSWSAPDGTRTYTGELPLRNTNGTQGVSYEMPRGTPVSITVTNEGGMGSTSLGFAGTVACHIRVDGRLISDESAKGFHSSVTCKASADW